MNLKKTFFLLFIQALFFCHMDSVFGNTDKNIVTIEPLKWFNGHSAAVSLNFDITWRGTGKDKCNDDMVDAVVKRGLRADIELVTAKYVNYPGLVQSMFSDILPKGIFFFGHGHEHVNHDNYSYEYCWNSFTTCYNYLVNWGFKPKTYAYPGWSGKKNTTQLANKLAGFIAARGKNDTPDSMYICPGEISEPPNWYYMPCAAAGNYDPYIMSHSQMAPIIDTTFEKNAYLIITYHSVGNIDGWGYYPYDDFISDLEQIRSKDFWSGNMDDVVCYIKERNAFTPDIEFSKSSDDSIRYNVSFRDNLDNSIFNQPLTCEISFADSINVEEIVFSPPLADGNRFNVVDKKITVNVIPDESKYEMTLYLKKDEE